MFKKIICHVIIFSFLLPSFAWSQASDNSVVTDAKLPEKIECSELNEIMLGTLNIFQAEYVAENCDKTGDNAESSTNDDGSITYTELEYMFDEQTKTLTVTETLRTEVKGNVGKSFAPNIAIPIITPLPASALINSIDDINLTNYSKVLGKEVKDLIDDYRKKITEGYTFSKIEITATADKDWPNVVIPNGYSQEQVYNSYDLSESSYQALKFSKGLEGKRLAKTQADADKYNRILATNRGKNIKTLIEKLVLKPLLDKPVPNGKTIAQLSALIKFGPSNVRINHSERRVDVTDDFVKTTVNNPVTYNLTPKEEEIVEETTNTCEQKCKNERRKSKKNKCVRTCCRDKCLARISSDKRKQRQCKRQCGKSLLSKILIGVGITAAVGAAAYGISRIGKRNNESSAPTPGYTPPVDNSINGWKFISANKQCIPFKFDPSKLDNVMYFKEKLECLTRLSAPTNNTTNTSPGATVSTPSSNDDDIVESNNKSRDIVEDEPEVDNLSDSQILQQANSGIGQITTDDPGYCTNQKYKILDDCYMTGHNHIRQKDPNVTPHPNYKVRSKKGVVKLFMKKILVCQYVENRAKYTIILDRDCRNGNL